MTRRSSRPPGTRSLTYLYRPLPWPQAFPGWLAVFHGPRGFPLPALALKNAAKVLKTGEQKDRAGENLIKYFSVPCKPTKSNGGRTRNLPEHNPEGWKQFKAYCAQDVRTERDIRKILERFPMPDKEWTFYHMDQRINDRGVRIDTELVHQAIACDLRLSDEMSRRAYELTGLENPNSVSQLKSWLEDRGNRGRVPGEERCGCDDHGSGQEQL